MLIAPQEASPAAASPQSPWSPPRHQRRRPRLSLRGARSGIRTPPSRCPAHRTQWSAAAVPTAHASRIGTDANRLQPVRARREHRGSTVLPTSAGIGVVHDERPIAQQRLEPCPRAPRGDARSQVPPRLVAGRLVGGRPVRGKLRLTPEPRSRGSRARADLATGTQHSRRQTVVAVVTSSSPAPQATPRPARRTIRHPDTTVAVSSASSPGPTWRAAAVPAAHASRIGTDANRCSQYVRGGNTAAAPSFQHAPASA